MRDVPAVRESLTLATAASVPVARYTTGMTSLEEGLGESDQSSANVSPASGTVASREGYRICVNGHSDHLASAKLIGWRRTESHSCLPKPKMQIRTRVPS
jgi:hypothetical protein